MDIPVVIWIIAAVVLLVVKSIYDKINDKKKLEKKLADEWGQYPEKEYVPGKIESIKVFYDSKKNNSDIDDITWNDLDMDELFSMLNNTQSTMGEEILYSILRKPLFKKADIEYRNKLIEFFRNSVDDRLLLQRNLRLIGNNRKISFYEYFTRLTDIKKESNIIHYLINVIWVVAIVGIIFDAVTIFLPLIIVNVVISMFTYYKRKSEIESYYSIFNNLLKMIYVAKKISVLQIDAISNELEYINKNVKELNSFKRYSGVVLNPNGGSLADILFDYIRMLTHIDLIKFNSMLDTVIKKRDVIMSMHDAIGFLDVMIAAASFRDMQSHNGWCVPELSEDDISLTTAGIYHPYIEEPVTNSYSTDGCSVITGSNASGKSTFLKTIAINAILAQTIATVNAHSYKAGCYRVMTSMALSDNIFDNTSYFIVEIQSLKRILDNTGDVPVLCCIDEVLRGTNTIERIAASSQILKTISEKNVICLAATHDVELANILGKYFANYHFREQIVDDNILFDYTIYEGCTKTRNAIKLLQLLGYDKDIVSRAETEANNFTSNGVWNSL